MLDVGSGSGYLTACFSRAMQLKHGDANKGLVVGIEHQAELVKRGIDHVKMDDPSLLESGRIMFIGNYNFLDC